MSLYSATYGLLREGDRVSLSSDFSLSLHSLHDRVTGAQHQLSVRAHRVISALRSRPKAITWWVQLETLNQAERKELLIFLNQSGALQIDRSLTESIRQTAKHLHSLTLGFRPLTITYRRGLNFRSLMTATNRTLAGLSALVVTTCVLLYGAGLSANAAKALAVSLIVTLWLGTIIHEYAHIFVIRRSRQTGSVIQRGFNLGIIHHPLSPQREVIAAISGPTAGFLTSLASGYATAAVYDQVLLTICGWLCAGLHLLNLLPVSSDGRTLWRNLRKAGI